MTWRRPALAAALSALALGCAEGSPLAPTPKGAPAPTAGLKAPRHVEAAGNLPLNPANFQGFLWANGTAIIKPGAPSGPNAQNFAFSIVAGPNALPGALPNSPPAPGVGALYVFKGNTSTPGGTTSMFATIAKAVITHNANGPGGTATLTGTNTEGLPFTIKATDLNDDAQGDKLEIDAPGLFKGTAVVNDGDIRIVNALPRNQGAVGQAGVVFDNAIGLFISQADADDEVPGPQDLFSIFSNGIVAPPPQLPAPDALPTDTVNQDEVDFVRNPPRPLKL